MTSEYYCPVCERDLTNPVQLFGETAFEFHKALHERDRLRKAVIPFLRPEWTKILGGNVQGDDSIVFQRDGAQLTIGDFKRLKEAFDDGRRD